MGPLAGVKVLELEAIGPAPFAGMVLADLGADVLVIDRPGDAGLGLQRERWTDVMMRGKRSVTLDLKDPSAAGIAFSLVEKADALIEGFRPGVMERLGLGPDAALKRNPKLVYGRMTGWGQDGPPSPACSTPSAARAKRRCCRSTWLATSAAAACCSPLGW